MIKNTPNKCIMSPHMQSLGILGGDLSTVYPFKAGSQYTRKGVFRILGIDDSHGGSWHTGYTSHAEDHFIFCGVGTTGRTGHDYQNRFAGDELNPVTDLRPVCPNCNAMLHRKRPALSVSELKELIKHGG